MQTLKCDPDFGDTDTITLYTQKGTNMSLAEVDFVVREGELFFVVAQIILMPMTWDNT